MGKKSKYRQKVKMKSMDLSCRNAITFFTGHKLKPEPKPYVLGMTIQHKPGCGCSFDGINPMKYDDGCMTSWAGCYKRILELAIDASMRNDCEAERIGVYLNFSDK